MKGASPKGRRSAPPKLCGPEGELPIGDVMLAQKIALENDEQATLALANRGNPDQRPLRFG
jgi:hypothetical protein